MPANEKPQEAETKDLKDSSSVPKSPEETPSNPYQKNEEKRDHFPFPFFWMPAYDKKPEAEMKDLKEVSESPKSAEEAPSKLRTIPVKLLRNDDRGEKPGTEDGISGVHAKAAEEELKPKSIPMKQSKDSDEKESSGGTRTATKSIPVKQIEENANKSSHNGTKSQSGSPKASKLPPVCLRVDPLPRRKNGNGTSRSTSPPRGKEKLQKERDRTSLNSSDMVKESQDSKMQDPSLKVSEEQAGKNEMRNKSNKEDTVKNLRDVPVVSKEEMPETPVEKEIGIEKEQKNDKEEVESKRKKLDDARKIKKNLSVTEAAVLIQSAYRGYEVRKWEPLKKLRQVAKVREQVEEVRECIRALEPSPEFQRDKKQKVIIGETIMGLLLKLDVIQGLHPSIRDIRKSVARDLVSLQERLDSVASQESEGSKSAFDAPMNNAKQVVEILSETNVDAGVPLGRNEEEKQSEASKAPSMLLHGSETLPNGPTNELIESEEPLSEKEHTGSAGDEVVVGLPTNDVLSDSREQCEEKVLQPSLENKEDEKDSEREPSNTAVEPCLLRESIETPQMGTEEAQSEAEDMKLQPPLEDKEAEKDSEREPNNTAVEPCLVREFIETPWMGSEEAQSESEDVKLPIDMEEEKSKTSPETLMENELECKPHGLGELTLSMDSVADQHKVTDDVIQSSSQELPLGLLGGIQSSDSEENVEHVSRREEPETQSNDSGVEHLAVESSEFADSDSKSDSSVLQPSAKEEVTDEELMKNPKLEDSAQILQGFEERNHEEKLVEDQVIANFDSSQAVGTLPSDSTDHMTADQAAGVEQMIANVDSSQAVGTLPSDSTDHMTADQAEGTEVTKERKDDLSETEVHIDGCMVTEAASEASAPNVMEEKEEKDGTVSLETVTSDEVDHKPCDSEMVEGVVNSPATEMKGGINGVDHKPVGSGMVKGGITGSTAEIKGEITSLEPLAQVSHEQAPKILDVIQGEQVPLHEKDLLEDNEKLKEMVEKLVQAGREQLSVISDLNGRIKDLERKLKSKKKMRMRPRSVAAVSSAKRRNGPVKGNSVTCAA